MIHPDPGVRTAVLLSALSREGLGVSAADLAGLRVPVLVCGTAEDAIHPVGLAKALAAGIGGLRYPDLPPEGRDKAAHLAAPHKAISGFLAERRIWRGLRRDGWSGCRRTG
jgi:hypothetical protein